MKNVLVPKIRFKEFNDSWKKLKIKDIANVIGGGTPPTETEKFWNGSIQWFTPSEIGKSKYIANSERTISELGLENSSAKLLPSGTILLTSRATIGETSILLNSGTTNQGFQSLIAKPFMSNEFIYYLKYSFEKEMKIKAFGSTFLEISKKNLENIEVYITDYTEQEKIANFLSLLDKKIELQQKKIETLKIYKIGLIKKIFGDMKDNDSIRLKDLYHFAYGEGNTNPDNGGIYPVYGANGKIGSFNKYNAEYSVIIGHMGAYAGNVLFEENKHFVTYNGTIAIPKDVKILRPKFGYYMLLNTNLPKICAGSGMPFLSYEILNNIKVKLPDIKAQEKCEKILDKTEAKIKLEKIKFKNLRQLKKSLLQQMFI